jgi:hypothetical protein
MKKLIFSYLLFSLAAAAPFFTELFRLCLFNSETSFLSVCPSVCLSVCPSALFLCLARPAAPIPLPSAHLHAGSSLAIKKDKNSSKQNHSFHAQTKLSLLFLSVIRLNVGKTINKVSNEF